MNRELARKRPAQIVHTIDARPLPSRDIEIIRAASLAQLRAAVNARYASGAIEQDYSVGQQNGLYIARVTMRSAAAVRKRKLIKVAAVAGAVLAASAAFLWLLSALTPFWPLLVVAGSVGALLWLARGAQINISQVVNVKR